jgi:molybdenum cofactor cytidylyltransferase
VTPVAGLILAAGLGTRFGGHKLLAPIDGRPMLQHVLDLAAAASLDPVVVVLGTDSHELRAACSWRSEIRVHNPTPKAGLSGSVRIGLAELERSGASRVVVLLGDQPFLTLRQLRTVLGSDAAIVVPRYAGAPGTPVVLDRSVWPFARSLQGDRGFSQLFAAHPDLVSYVDVPGTNRDIDRPADLDEVTRA